MRKMANSVNDEVASFDFAFEEALKCPSQFNMSSALKSEQKEASTVVLLQWFRFTRVYQFASNKLWRVNLQVLLFVLQNIVYDRIKKNRQIARLTSAIIKDCSLENIKCS